VRIMFCVCLKVHILQVTVFAEWVCVGDGMCGAFCAVNEGSCFESFSQLRGLLYEFLEG